MAETRPNLVAVGSRPAEASPPPAPESDGTTTRRGLWLLTVLLVIAAVALAFQTRQVAELTGRAESLEAELWGAQQTLGRYEQRFERIQTTVGDLRTQLTQLEELIEQPPVDPANR